jgi:hypothetical protein
LDVRWQPVEVVQTSVCRRETRFKLREPAKDKRLRTGNSICLE